MRHLVLSALVLSLVPTFACSAADTGTSADDEALKAKAPIPYVLQWTGDYEGDGTGDIAWVDLHRTGTFAASVNGKIETGRFAGPSKPGQWPLEIAFITHGDYFKGTISQWSDSNGHAVMTLDHYGTTQTVTAPWSSPSEAACDATNGTWTDDDANPVTGLYCDCPKATKWIPSAGGCVK